MMEINRLPAEMLLEVHRRMTPSNLKNAVLVDKLWRDVGQDPALWEWCKVAVYTKEDIDNLSIKRLRRIKEILINPENWDADDWEAFFRAVEQFSSLKKIDGLGRWTSGMDLVEPDLFARSLAKLEDVVVRGCTYEQIQALFTEMSITTQVKTFHLSSGDLFHIEPSLFGSVLSRLENLKLEAGIVTKDQMQALFTEIMNNSSLKRLDLLNDFCELMWNHLEPRFFSKVLSTVEDLSLTITDDGDYDDHMEALFIELSLGTPMKRLRLHGIALYEIEPALFANALSRLEELRLCNCGEKDVEAFPPVGQEGDSLEETLIFDTYQIQALVTEISLRTQMKKLALEGDLSELDPGLFARVIVRLEDVVLTSCNITINQMMELFTEMSHHSHLKSLKISYIDLSRVDPEVLAKAVVRLEAVTLHATDMTNDQVVSIFSEMSQNTVMKKIDLDWTYWINWNYWIDYDLSSIVPEVLASALIRLEEVKAVVFDITDDQAKAFFGEMVQNSQNCNLKKLSLYGGDFSAVDPEVLAVAVTNVKEVCLVEINLSLEQITNIFTHVLEGEKKVRKLDLRGTWYGGYGDLGNVNQENMRKVKEKLKGEFQFF